MRGQSNSNNYIGLVLACFMSLLDHASPNIPTSIILEGIRPLDDNPDHNTLPGTGKDETTNYSNPIVFVFVLFANYHRPGHHSFSFSLS